jgi:Asp-tRNA(Asn)/Glu-tRNA(Gln) amidotransferase A subunit family amidase
MAAEIAAARLTGVTEPTGPGRGGLPVGAQHVGLIGEDARVLSAAFALEVALGLE